MRPAGRRLGGLALVSMAAWGLLAPSASAQQFNGLWWQTYDAFQPSPDVAPGLWWDHYQPPMDPVWNGPYYTVSHWNPYYPRVVVWSGLVYNEMNFPPQSTRPNGWYAPASPGPQSFPQNAAEFWEYIWPILAPETRSVLRTQLGDIAPPEPPPATAPVPAPEEPAPRVKQGFKQYYKPVVLGPLKTRWQVREAPAIGAPPAPRPVRSEPTGFTQYYRPMEGEKTWSSKTAKPAKVITPKR